jgi:hypothetical protein
MPAKWTCEACDEFAGCAAVVVEVRGVHELDIASIGSAITTIRAPRV